MEAVVTVRLFAHLRELAGTSRWEVDASDVAQVLAAARQHFGPTFTEGLKSAAIWVDGEPVDDLSGLTLRPSAEVALVPPVSGGAR
jgi:molybdopterin converting factor small subunit